MALALDSQAIGQRLGPGFQSTLGSFNKIQSVLGLIGHLGANWDVEGDFTKTHALLTSTIATDLSLTVTYYAANDWDFALGAGKTKYDDSTPASSYGLFSVHDTF